MFCNQCGASLPDGSKFCNVCGAQLITYENVQAQGNMQDAQGQNYAQETYAQSQGATQSPVDRTAQMNVNPNVPMQAAKQASKSIWPIIGGAVAAVAVVTGIVLAIVKPFSKGDKSDTQVEMQGIDFKITTEIVSTEKEAIVGVEEPHQDIASGVDLLTEEDYSDVPDVADAMDPPSEISVDEVPEYDALIDFLNDFERYRDQNWTREYDCDNIFISGDYSVIKNLLGAIMCIDPSRYAPLEYSTLDGEPGDPNGYMNDDYREVSLEGLKWLALNIFNMPEGVYSESLDNLLNDELYTINNDRINYLNLGVGWIPDILEVQKIEVYGRCYYVYYSFSEPDPNDMDKPDGPPTYYVAKMELKNIDGTNYWSIYYNHEGTEAEY